MSIDVKSSPRRVLAELQARASLAGWSITQAEGGYIVSRWGMSRTLLDLPAVEAFLKRAGVKS